MLITYWQYSVKVLAKLATQLVKTVSYVGLVIS